MAFGAKTLAELGFHGQRPLAITGLSVDSRLTREGHLFAALPGSKSHGAEFVPMAVRMGAVAVLTALLPRTCSLSISPALAMSSDRTIATVCSVSISTS